MTHPHQIPAKPNLYILFTLCVPWRGSADRKKYHQQRISGLALLPSSKPLRIPTVHWVEGMLIHKSILNKKAKNNTTVFSFFDKTRQRF